ncbi:MAG: hypothetical protein IKX79_01085 [Desulfovibrionaceae bacterium]|nr:hypothetical protein [Desulfovibrionaceae bacterium]MBR5734120.1 hypothetical protein [Desulfovibrionaceae bacterium]
MSVMGLAGAPALAVGHTSRTMEAALQHPASPWHGAGFEAEIPEVAAMKAE